jgi:nitrobenzene nitroreductase
MQVSLAVRERRSCRAFLGEPVPMDTVRQIVDLAKWAPSWANAQEWDIFVLQGAVLEQLRSAFELLGEHGVPGVSDLPMPAAQWPQHLAARLDPSAPTGGGAGAIPPHVRAGGPSIWSFYDAPCLVLFAIDAGLEPAYASFDVGLMVQTFCLVAEDRGFSTCIMATAVQHADVLHEAVPEADGKLFVVGVALGRADHTAVVNRGERGRVQTEELVTFLGGEA